MFPKNGLCYDYIPLEIVVQSFPSRKKNRLQKPSIEQKNQSAMSRGRVFDDS
jgi:hypothetical protein